MATNSAVEQQNVTIDFSESTYIPAKYVFEMDDRPDTDQTLYGAVRIRKYPAYTPGTWSPVGTPMYFDQSINTLVTEGHLQGTNEVREKEVAGSCVVNGDSEATLPYPVVHGLSYEIDGNVYDIRGGSIHVNVGFDSVKNCLIFSRPCYAVVKYFYITQYQILRYYPNIYNDYETYYMPDPNDYGQLLGFIRTPSTLPAISPVVFAISPPEGISAEFELYRVESTGYAKEDGIWEKPMGYPDNGSYPNSSETLDSNDSNIEIARTHEIGYFSLLNNVSRMAQYRSASAETLPMDLSTDPKVRINETTQTSGNTSALVRTVSVDNRKQHVEAVNKYKRLLNRAPKMRTVHYDVPVGKPYSEDSDVNQRRQVVRTVVQQEAGGGSMSTVNTIVQTFRIKLTVKAPTRPSISTAVVRNQSNSNNVDFNMQAQRINTMLSRIWEGVDWNHLRQRITNSYDPELYQVTFDSSFPSTS